MHSASLFTSTLALAGIADANWFPGLGTINPGFEPHAFDVVENGITLGVCRINSLSTSYPGLTTGSIDCSIGQLPGNCSRWFRYRDASLRVQQHALCLHRKYATCFLKLCE